MRRPVVIADRDIPYLRGLLEPDAEVRYLGADEISTASVAEADALVVRTRTRCAAPLLDGSPVRFIASATTGVDHIDADYCRDQGILWTAAPGCNSWSVAQYVASALVALSRRRGLSLPEKTLGIVGVGHVGSKVARIAAVLGLKVLLCDPPRQRTDPTESFVSLREIAASSDIITFHVPLTETGTDRTFHLLDRSLIATAAKRPIVINTSRGEVGDSAALKAALRCGDIAGAVFDVWEGEPAIDRELLGLADIGTPHIAGYSADGKANGTAVCVRALREFFGLRSDAAWYPALPDAPGGPHLSIAADGRSAAEVLEATYRIADDDARLRASPEEFERLRSAYPVRREYPYYRLPADGLAPGAAESLARLGFARESVLTHGKGDTQ